MPGTELGTSRGAGLSTQWLGGQSPGSRELVAELAEEPRDASAGRPGFSGLPAPAQTRGSSLGLQQRHPGARLALFLLLILDLVSG